MNAKITTLQKILYLVLTLSVLSCATTKTEYYGATISSIDTNMNSELGVYEIDTELNVFESADFSSDYHFRPTLEIINSPNSFYLINLPISKTLNGTSIYFKIGSRTETLLPLLVTDIEPQSAEGVSRTEHTISTTIGSFQLSYINLIPPVGASLVKDTKLSVIPGPNWTFLKPSDILRDANNSNSETVTLRLVFNKPDSYSFQPREALSGHYLPSKTFTVKTWDLRKVIKNYFHSGVKLTILDARSLTPIEGTEIIIQDNTLPNLADAFKNQKVYENIVSVNPDLFNLPTDNIRKTNGMGEYHLFPYFANSVKDSVQIIVRHPNYEPFQGHLPIISENEEWEILLPRIGQRIEIGEAPNLKSTMRKKDSGN